MKQSRTSLQITLKKFAFPNQFRGWVLVLAVASFLSSTQLAFAESATDPGAAPSAGPVQAQQTESQEQTAPHIANALEDLRFGAAFEFIAPIPLQNGSPDSDRARVRSLEVSAKTNFDHISAKVTVGAFDDSGLFVLGVREGFLQAVNLLPDFDVRVGKFFLPIGLYNQTRHSAWATSSAPLLVTNFFGNDGVVDTGADFIWRLGRRGRIEFGITNGYTFNNGTGIGAKPLTPTHYARPSYDLAVSENRSLTLALNYLGRMDDTGEVMKLMGLDFELIPHVRASRDWFAQGEIFSRYRKPAAIDATKELGTTVYAEKQFRDTLAAGIRIDSFSITSLNNSDGSKRANLNLAFTPVFTFAKSAGLKFQALYSFLTETRSGNSTRNEQVIELRAVTELGEIPKFRGL